MCIEILPIYEFMWGDESKGELARKDAKNPIILLYGVVPVLSGYFFLYEVISTHFQEN